MAWKHTYVEFDCVQMSQASSGGGNTYRGSIFIIVNTAAHVAHHIAQAQNILAPSYDDSDKLKDRHPQKRKIELNVHLFSALTGLQSLLDAVASACNAEYPKVPGDVSFFPGREDKEYPFVTSEVRKIQKYKDEILALPGWGGKSFNQIANALKHECPFSGEPIFATQMSSWDISKGGVGLLRDILEPTWKSLLGIIKHLAIKNSVPLPQLIAI
jgi:hypothetical protein